MSVFIIDHEFKTILNPDAVRLTDQLSRISEEDLMYIILAYDYTQSPYRMKPEDERKNLARKKVYGTMDRIPEKSVIIKSAIEEYKSLIFDVRRETIDNYKEKIIRLQKQSLMKDIDTAKLKEVDIGIQFLMKRIVELESEIFIDEKFDFTVKGGKKISFVEKWQMNMKRYRAHRMDY